MSKKISGYFITGRKKRLQNIDVNTIHISNNYTSSTFFSSNLFSISVGNWRPGEAYISKTKFTLSSTAKPKYIYWWREQESKEKEKKEKERWRNDHYWRTGKYRDKEEEEKEEEETQKT